MEASFYQTIKNILQNTSVLELPARVAHKIMLANSVFVLLLLLVFQPFQLYRSTAFDLLSVSLSTAVYVFSIHALFSHFARRWMSNRSLSRRQVFYLEFATTAIVITVVAAAVFATRLLLNKVPFSIENTLLFLAYALVLAPMLLVVTRTVIVVRVMHALLHQPQRKTGSSEEAQEQPTVVTIKGLSAQDLCHLVLDDFLFANAEGNYVKITSAKAGGLRSSLLRCTFSSLVEQLAPFHQLVRCHRSYIVNMQKVTHVVSENQTKRLRLMDTDLCIPVSRAKAKAVAAQHKSMQASL